MPADSLDDVSAPAPRGPILVTGVPRSGTTWLARLLASAPRTALTGREPMNPRGRQYALAGTVDGWARLEHGSPAQRRALRLAYRGLTPKVYSKYGRHQWAAPLPWTRVVVKDPFALLSMPAVIEATGARCVLVYRHPGAVLSSYRRMGWSPDLDEVAPLVVAHRASARPGDPMPELLPAPGESEEPEAVGLFWSALHAIALDDASRASGVIVVSHEELSIGGVAAAQRLFARLGLGWSAEAEQELSKESGPRPAGPSSAATTGPTGTTGTTGMTSTTGTPDPSRLHNFDRAPVDVAASWRATLAPGELERIEAVTADVRARLESARIRLT